ncbi:MAG: KH domain-containing protein [Deltaproteobacteria bacterium]|nr:KH domain-containing protein [Deltaproteobacteria bacterium]
MDLKDLVAYVARSLVDHPDEVRVDELPGDRTTVLELRVHPEDLGKVIGKQGRTARALRTVVSAAATRSGARATVEIME